MIRRHSRREALKLALSTPIISLAPLAIGSAAAQPALVPVQMGIQIFTGAVATVWVDNKIPAKRGLAVEGKQMADGRSVRDAMISGALNAGTMNVTPFLVGAVAASLTLVGIVSLGGDTVGVMARKGAGINSIADLKGKRLGVFTTVSGTLVWSALVKQMHDAQLVDGDYQIIVADIQNLSNLLARGEIDACICYPDLSARELRDGSVRPLYDGKSSADLFAELNAPGHDGPMGNVFVGRKDWVDAHPGEVSAFLDLWDRGLAEWRAHRDEMIERYP